jgi:glutamate/tyrosine decarboxylase-like PLP-dependent enzyme
MTIAASYLPAISEGERDPSHYVPELSRRARGFSTWAMLRHLGREGLTAMVERHCRLARMVAKELEAVAGVEIANDVVLNQIAIRFGSGMPVEVGDEITRKVISAVQEDGVCFAGGAHWKGRWIMRFSIIGFPCSEADALRSVESIARSATAVTEE